MDDNGDAVFDRAERYVYDGTQIVYVFDDSGSLANRYLWGPALDQLFADQDALGEILWSLTDHQGSVRDVVEYDAPTDTTSVINHVQYDAFGNITGLSNPSADFLYAYTGQDWDPDTGLLYYNARWRRA